VKNSTVLKATVLAALTTTGAAAAMAGLPCYPSPRFTTTPTEVVDGKTGLTWQRGVASVAKTWAEAKAYCPTVGANFRLPSVKELLTIVDFTKSNPAIDTTVFPGTTAAVFWTSSAVAGNNPSHAWSVNFGTSRAGSYGVGGAGQVRCVR